MQNQAVKFIMTLVQHSVVPLGFTHSQGSAHLPTWAGVMSHVKSLGPRVSFAHLTANHMRRKQGDVPRAINADAKQCPL